MTLADLPLGASAIIERVGGERSSRRRLLELGLLPGTPVRVLQRAPLGDPLRLSVRQTHLSIRLGEAAQIAVSGDSPA